MVNVAAKSVISTSLTSKQWYVNYAFYHNHDCTMIVLCKTTACMMSIIAYTYIIVTTSA